MRPFLCVWISSSVIFCHSVAQRRNLVLRPFPFNLSHHLKCASQDFLKQSTLLSFSCSNLLSLSPALSHAVRIGTCHNKADYSNDTFRRMCFVYRDFHSAHSIVFLYHWSSRCTKQFYPDWLLCRRNSYVVSLRAKITVLFLLTSLPSTRSLRCATG